MMMSKLALTFDLVHFACGRQMPILGLSLGYLKNCILGIEVYKSK
jgi:hypothetical protein